jgi:hypothetical protein
MCKIGKIIEKKQCRAGRVKSGTTHPAPFQIHTGIPCLRQVAFQKGVRKKPLDNYLWSVCISLGENKS